MLDGWKRALTMLSYFVTATGTDIGKTYVTSNISARRGRWGWISRRSSRCSPATMRPRRGPPTPHGCSPPWAKKVTLRNIAAISPWRFAAPLSPDMAAAREGRTIDFATLVSFCEAATQAAPDVLLIEGLAASPCRWTTPTAGRRPHRRLAPARHPGGRHLSRHAQPYHHRRRSAGGARHPGRRDRAERERGRRRSAWRKPPRHWQAACRTRSTRSRATPPRRRSALWWQVLGELEADARRG